MNVDVTAFIDGMHGDTSATFAVGTPSPAMAGLIETTRLATLLGIDAIRPFEPLQRVAEAIEPFATPAGTGSCASTAATGSARRSTPIRTSPTTSTGATT